MIIWIDSYPKSGNTYLRSFLSSYYYSKEGKFDFDQLLEYTNEKIADYYPGEGISIRTLSEDIKLFKDSNGFDAPLSNMRRVYRYTDPNFSIASIRPITPHEIRSSNSIFEELLRILFKIAEKIESGDNLESNSKSLGYCKT